MSSFFDTKIEFLKGVGPQKAALLNKELSIFTYADLIQHYPFRHEDRTQFYTINAINETMPYIQVRGKIKYIDTVGEGAKKRLIGAFRDGTGVLELIWFQGVAWVSKNVKLNEEYIVFGKPSEFNGAFSIVHPELELYNPNEEQSGFLQPVYSVTEKLKKRYLDSKALSKIIKHLLDIALPSIPETLPDYIMQQFGFINKKEALLNIHFPRSVELLEKAKNRLKFEELFYTQLKILKQKVTRTVTYQGQVFKQTSLLTEFYNNHLPFELTSAQKRVIKEIYRDMVAGKQMNRLLQGDVGSGKTIVAFIAILMAVDNGAQACLMAPTEILADQHYNGLKPYADALGIGIDKLTGSSRTGDRKVIHDYLLEGDLKILIGTHALLEEKVQFKNLGLCIIDEQHRFGVEQRARLWHKNEKVFPHILVMTATPIPRTLAMTLYGDLDSSIIDELPAGRKPIVTVHRYDSHRLKVFGFIREQINEGKQVYMVYPLIEESEKLDYKDLMDGYESISRAFPEFQISILHGRMRSQDKDYEMQRFINKETQIMVATTVIEVGVNVPNACIMVIENSERFGLSQLHQLRGRVGRGADQSYCILMTDYKLSKEARTRIETMVKTNNGFEIADIDLKLRGPGDLMGTQQSGVLDLLIADLAKDGAVLQEARKVAQNILEVDTQLETPQNAPIRKHLDNLKKSTNNWSRIS